MTSEQPSFEWGEFIKTLARPLIGLSLGLAMLFLGLTQANASSAEEASKCSQIENGKRIK